MSLGQLKVVFPKRAEGKRSGSTGYRYRVNMSSLDKHPDA